MRRPESSLHQPGRICVVFDCQSWEHTALLKNPVSYIPAHPSEQVTQSFPAKKPRTDNNGESASAGKSEEKAPPVLPWLRGASQLRGQPG